MTVGVRKGLAVAAIHVAIVSSLGAKLLIDRATLPRVWARVTSYDPSLPIRGRYLRLQIEGTLRGAKPDNQWVSLAVEDGALVFLPAGNSGQFAWVQQQPDGTVVARLAQPVLFFIPEHEPDPSNRKPGEELWAEVTVPRRGGPRPIRLGVKKDGRLTPLQ